MTTLNVKDVDIVLKIILKVTVAKSTTIMITTEECEIKLELRDIKSEMRDLKSELRDKVGIA